METPASGVIAPGVVVELETDPTLGYASIQNDVPVVRVLRVRNDGPSALADVIVTVRCSPAFAHGANIKLASLAPGETRDLGAVDLQPQHEHLRGLTEAEAASVEVVVTSNGERIGGARSELEVLAYEQWAGTRSLVELVAAFVMPNAQAVDVLLGKASRLLRNAQSDLSMDGYKSKHRDLVWKQVSSFYSAIAAEDLQYALPPASFTNDGQKIRSPDRVLGTKVGTCLDLTLLFASCLEQAHLHPVLLFKEGHAFVGCWLVPSHFPTAVVDDVQAIRKRVQSGEFLVFECTGIAAGQKTSLRQSVDIANAHLSDGGSFRFAVDIARARELRILPLPSRSEDASPTAYGDAATIAPAVEPTPDLPPLDPALLPLVDADLRGETPEGRLAHWKRKLLDLTLRNRLLNFKPTRTSLRVVAKDLEQIADDITQGRDYAIRGTPALMTGDDPRSAVVHKGRTGGLPLQELALEALQRRELVVGIEVGNLEPRLLEIFSAAQTGLEEGGANTLFLALGMLRWQEAEKAESKHLAPILLIPVTLTRQSVRSGYRLARHDDDPLINPTLLQLLREQFNFAIPEFDFGDADERGMDVERVFQAFRLATKEAKGWEVEAQAYLGIFSFTKYLMWKDLQDRASKLKDNRVVAHLVDNPGAAYAPEPPRNPRTLDDTHKPQDLLAPMLADSSQLMALCTAADGRDFVLRGPPGTGKSQTIANLITHFLGNGKTVLFVSEKMAALEVVHRRLKHLGLGPFCLELHSAKAKKHDVVLQFGQSLEAVGAQSSEAWGREAEGLASLRQELNGVANALHKEHGNGLTVFDATGTAIAYQHWSPAAFGWTAASQHSYSELEELRTTVRQMRALAQQLPVIATHPLRQVGNENWSHGWQDEWLLAVGALEQSRGRLEAAATPLWKLLGLAERGQSAARYVALDHLADVLLAIPPMATGVAAAAHDPATRAQIDNYRRHSLARTEVWKPLAGEYRENFGTLDADSLSAAWFAAAGKWFLPKWQGQSAVRRQLGSFRKDGKNPTVAQVPALLEALFKLNAEDKVLEPMRSRIEGLLGDFARGPEPDWNAVERQTAWTAAFASAVERLAGPEAGVLGNLQHRLGPCIAGGSVLLGADGALGQGLITLRDCYREFATGLAKVTKASLPITPLLGPADAAGSMARLAATLAEWRQSERMVQHWCFWRRTRATALRQGLDTVVTALESGAINLPSVVEYFEYSYRTWWLKRAIDEEPALREFSSADHQRKIFEFRTADQKFQDLTKRHVVALLSQRIPTATAVAPSADSEMGKLRRELAKQRKHLPVRQLVQGMPTLLPKLKPCLLMSPLSVAQYMDANSAVFDLVVFDEASQIPVWDAIGAIARGRQLVVVGDPEQLPPTSFFQKTDDQGTDDFQQVEDLESILDECLGAGLAMFDLEWHYRSRHESLITFSNIKYYESKLITFPSPVTDDVAVRLEKVPGVYDRGGSRTNRIEAQALVGAIEKHYLDSTKEGLSLGVVTFNQPQQMLIVQLVDARRRDNPEFDRALSRPRSEPLFIKNLENVQGDERDYIFFSITYGADAAGRVNMTFGPLNLDGGQRRLNVAVSRAREGVVVFTSLMPDQIDLSRVRAAGVRDLKHYLEFALKGPRALTEQSSPTGLDHDSPFEQMVAKALRDKGWTVHAQVGCSGYRIDLAVVDPRAPGRYLLGVECDGRSYHSAATARDRDRLRQQVLEGLGWRIHRIWSTDWWHDQATEVERLHRLLEDMKAEDGEAKQALPPSSNEDSTAEEVEGEQRDERSEYADAARVEEEMEIYRESDMEDFSMSDFYDPGSTGRIRGQLARAIGAEGPVAEHALFPRVARAWGLNRTGRLIVERLKYALSPTQTVSDESGTRFLWPEGVDPNTWSGFRIADSTGASQRHVTLVCRQELGNIALHLLASHGSMSDDDLARTVARAVGMARVPEEAVGHLREVFAWMEETGRVRRVDGILRCPSSAAPA